MRKLMLIFTLSLFFLTEGNAQFADMDSFTGDGTRFLLEMNVRYVDPTCEIPQPSRVPSKRRTVWQNGHTLYLYSQFAGFILNIVSGTDVVYSAVLPAYSEVLTLPCSLKGMYELQIVSVECVYYCEIELQ